MSKKTMVIIGNGTIANHIIDVYNDKMLEPYELAAVLGRTEAKTIAAAQKGNCRSCGTIEEVLKMKPWIVVETASVQAVREYALPVIEAGSHFASLSIGGFAEKAFREQILAASEKSGAKVYLSSGCIGGLDVLRTISLMGAEKAELNVVQNAADLRGTALFHESLITDGVDRCIFDGTADEAIRIMPTHINIGVAAALASVGTAKTKVRMNTTPIDERDIASIRIKGDGAFAEITAGSYPDAQLAGWGMVATLKNIVSGIVFA